MEPLERLQRLLGGRLYSLHRTCREKPVDYGRWDLTGPAARGLMMTIFPLMSPKRKARIRECLMTWKNRPLINRLKTHCPKGHPYDAQNRSEEHTSELQSQSNLVC